MTLKCLVFQEKKKLFLVYKSRKSLRDIQNDFDFPEDLMRKETVG
jgi:hypothetical protein